MAPVIILAFASTPRADAPRLRGDYAFSTSGFCAVAPAGFTPDFVALGATVFNPFSVAGALSFNGDGTGNLTGRVVTWGAGAMAAVDITGRFTYDVDANGTLTLQVVSQENVFVTGPRTGQHVQVSGQPPLVGGLSSDGKSLVLATAFPSIEVITQGGVGESARVCQRSQTGVRIGGD